MTLTELLDILNHIAEENDPDEIEVRQAHQPGWPLEYSIGQIACIEGDAEDKPIVYLGEGNQIGYLPGRVCQELGWR